MLMRGMIGAAVAMAIGVGDASAAHRPAQGLRAGPVSPLTAATAASTDGACESAPLAFARATALRDLPASDWCVSADVHAISATPDWTADLELPLGLGLAATNAAGCGPQTCSASGAIGTVAVHSETPLGTIQEAGTLSFASPAQLVATFAQAGAQLPSQSATLDLLTGPYGGQVVRVSAWPSLRSTEAGDVSAVPQRLVLRFWGRQRGSGLRMPERCDVRHQSRLLLRAPGAPEFEAAMVDDYALTGCAGRTTASALSALPSALTPFFATQARAKGQAGAKPLGWLHTVLVPELAAGTEIVASLRTPGMPARSARASSGAAGDATLHLRPRAVITKASRLSITATVPGGQAVRERFRFALKGGALRARLLPQAAPSTTKPATSASRPQSPH